MPPQMYYNAAIWENIPDAEADRLTKACYEELLAFCDQQQLAASARRMVLKGKWMVMVHYDRPFPPRIETKILTLLTTMGGTLTELDPGLLDEIAARRSQMIASKQGRTTKGNLSVVEHHEPYELPYKAQQHEPTYQETEATARVASRHFDEKQDPRLPFILRYKERRSQSFSERVEDYKQLIEQISKVPVLSGREQYQFVVSATRKIFVLCLDASEKYRFTPSALRMHQAVSPQDRLDPSWVPIERHVWLELEEPLEDPHGPVRALFVHRAFPEREIDQVVDPRQFKQTNEMLRSALEDSDRTWLLSVIREDTFVTYAFSYSARSGKWSVLSSHKCPYNRCTTQDEVSPIPGYPNRRVISACKQCQADILHWASWWHTTVLMLQQHYATSPDPQPFSVERVTYEEHAQVQRQKSKKKRHEVTKHSIPFKIVRYEVSEQPLHGEDERELEEEPGEEAKARTNWLVLHGPSDIIWEKVTIPDHTRRFPVRRDGTRQVGTVSVHYEGPKYVPMLRPDLRKRATIKRVVARRYEKEQEEREGGI